MDEKVPENLQGDKNTKRKKETIRNYKKEFPMEMRAMNQPRNMKDPRSGAKPGALRTKKHGALGMKILCKNQNPCKMTKEVYIYLTWTPEIKPSI